MELFKFVSRKFIVTLGAIVAIAEYTDGPMRMWTISGIATIYVIVQAILDAKGKPKLLNEVVDAVEKGIREGQTIVDETTATQPVTDGASSPSEVAQP